MSLSRPAGEWNGWIPFIKLSGKKHLRMQSRSSGTFELTPKMQLQLPDVLCAPETIQDPSIWERTDCKRMDPGGRRGERSRDDLALHHRRGNR